MACKPKIEIHQYDPDDRYSWAVLRSDRIHPICSGISRDHAEHILKILRPQPELPETLPPIKDWYNHRDIVGVDANGYGVANS